MYVCRPMYVCIYVCMYVCMYVCIYLYVCMYVHVCIFPLIEDLHWYMYVHTLETSSFNILQI